MRREFIQAVIADAIQHDEAGYISTELWDNSHTYVKQYT